MLRGSILDSCILSDVTQKGVDTLIVGASLDSVSSFYHFEYIKVLVSIQDKNTDTS